MVDRLAEPKLMILLPRAEVILTQMSVLAFIGDRLCSALHRLWGRGCEEVLCGRRGWDFCECVCVAKDRGGEAALLRSDGFFL